MSDRGVPPDASSGRKSNGSPAWFMIARPAIQFNLFSSAPFRVLGRQLGPLGL